MDIQKWYELKKKLCNTLEEMTSRKSFDRADIDVIDKLTHSIEKIKKIIETEGDSYEKMNSGYGSRGGMWSAEGSYGHMMDDPYNDRMSFARDNYSRASGNMDSSRSGMDRMPRVNY